MVLLKIPSPPWIVFGIPRNLLKRGSCLKGACIQMVGKWSIRKRTKEGKYFVLSTLIWAEVLQKKKSCKLKCMCFFLFCQVSESWVWIWAEKKFEIFWKMETLRIKGKARKKRGRTLFRDQFFPFLSFLSLFLSLAVLKWTFQIQKISDVLFGISWFWFRYVNVGWDESPLPAQSQLCSSSLCLPLEILYRTKIYLGGLSFQNETRANSFNPI